MSNFGRELTTQPQTWRRAAELAAKMTRFPPPGARVAFLGCETFFCDTQPAAAFARSIMLDHS